MEARAARTCSVTARSSSEGRAMPLGWLWARMTELAEQEMAIETLMASKGFSEAVVSLTNDSVDVVVDAAELTDANRAQIEDIVTRKTEIAPENIVITPIHE